MSLKLPCMVEISLYGFVRGLPESVFHPKCTRKTVKYDGSKIIIWECFSHNSVGFIFKINAIMGQNFLGRHSEKSLQQRKNFIKKVGQRT